METLTELLEEQVKDLYSAENQLLKALPRMAKKASTRELIAAYQKHLGETQGHVDRLTQVGETLGIKLTGKVCAAMKGLIEEGKEVLEEPGKSAVIDAALIAASQRVEHYEMAAYGCVKTLAEVLGHQELVDLFDETLAEEKATDEALTQVAEENVYPNAPKTEDEGEEGEEDDDESAAPSGKGGRPGTKAGTKAGTKSVGASSGRSAASSTGNRKPPSREAASRGGKSSGGKSKSR